MASNIDQFADLELSKEDREQIFDDPLDVSQPLTPQNGSTWVVQSLVLRTEQQKTKQEKKLVENRKSYLQITLLLFSIPFLLFFDVGPGSHVLHFLCAMRVWVSRANFHFHVSQKFCSPKKVSKSTSFSHHRKIRKLLSTPTPSSNERTCLTATF